MTAYYNDNSPFVAEWLRRLIRAGRITDGVVDERPIQEVLPSDVRGFTRCHFFAGVAGWELALSLAGWRDEPIWTGSCPCQPFSRAGRRQGTRDSRHLWPEFYRLIQECRPAVVFGEQTDGPDGREWLAGVRDDLEAAGYAAGAANLPAACVASLQIRQRLWWVAESGSERREARSLATPPSAGASFARDRCIGLGIADSTGWSEGLGWPAPARYRDTAVTAGGGVGDALRAGLPQRSRSWPRGEDAANPWKTSIPTSGRDGRVRRVEPGIWPVADRVPGRVELLRAYGNAIVPQCGAEFIRAYMER